MKALVATALVALALGAAASAQGFGFGFAYTGDTGGHLSNLGFDLKRTDSGHLRVQHFTVTALPIVCSDSTDTTSSGGFALHGSMKVDHRHFSGKGDWSTIPSDPNGAVTGVLHPGGTAGGTLKLHGELAGAGTHCHTGELSWTAAKAA